MREALLYCRVSSDRQEREGFSIPAQLELLRGYAERHDLKIIQEYQESETAKSAGRPCFAEMIHFAKAYKKPLVILVEKTDRLYRNFRDFLSIDDLITQNDLEVHLVKENEILGKQASSHAKFIHGIKVLMAKNYIDNLSEEIRKGRRQKVLQGGWHTKAPYGYLNIHKQGIHINPEQAPLVIRAFQLYASGLYSLDTVRDKLLEEGFFYNAVNAKIPRSRLHEMLQNPAYIGQIPFKGEVYDGKHEPLISMDTWNRVQQAFRKDNKPISASKHSFVYSGFVTCGECGRAVVGELKKGKYVYYRCAAKKEGCTQGYYKEALLDEAVNEKLHSIQIPVDGKQALRDGLMTLLDPAETTGNEQLDRLRRQEDRIKAQRKIAYQDRTSGAIDFEMWQEADKEYREQLNILRAQMDKVTEADTNLFEKIDMWVELPDLLNQDWKEADEEDKKHLLVLIQSNFKIKDGDASLELHPLLVAVQETYELLKTRKWPDNFRTFFIENCNEIERIYRGLVA